MSNGVDIVALRAELEAEREWREAEMRALRNQVASLRSEEERKVARKALVVMLYAHFEGWTKAALQMYVRVVNNIQLRVHEAAPALGAATLEDAFRILREARKKCVEFVRELPDDATLHRFAREHEFVELHTVLTSRVVRIDADKIVDTESNLKPVVLRKCLFRLGLDTAVVGLWEGGIQQLLRRRNDVAHGNHRDGLEKDDYESLEATVKAVLDGVSDAIVDGVARERFRVQTRNAESGQSVVAQPS